ncbi:glycosyltransferase family 2 protein [Fulvivirga sp. M361]|uniref:glycosyltransferase n=1 Tax=Fulvivirga sp. M361 TaxID=2594266 RepID=UPI00117A4B6A|nr:glycosyltransferase [Fulvivirga sp. M361]TRX55609.1 glycosyltransferase family 2 protein [Fulvivirga sp. M361]
MEVGASVIICCHNSAKRIPVVLAKLVGQVIPDGMKWEIILVDNASSDNTSEVALKLWQSHKSRIPFRIVDQPLKGLRNARDKGIEEAQYDILIFCDDDNWLKSDYVRLGMEVMDHYPKVAVLGGVGEGAFEGKKPSWFDKMEHFYAVGEMNSSSGDISDTVGRVFGAGMIIRKSHYEELKSLGLSGVLSGRKGNSLSGGEDTELCLLLRMIGKRIFYDQRLKFEHFMPGERLKISYLIRLAIGLAKSKIWLMATEHVLMRRKLNPRNVWLKDAMYLIMNIFKLLTSVKYYRNNSLLSIIIRLIYDYTMILELIKSNTSYDHFIAQTIKIRQEKIGHGVEKLP